MNLYQRLGFLILGSRLRRLSESFLSEINRAYATEGIDFDASWFPVFYLLSENPELSIKELSVQIEISHPAASQLISGLKSKGLVITRTSQTDGRKQLVALTEKGQALLETIKPVWDAILVSMYELVNSKTESALLLEAITALETAFQPGDLAQRIQSNLAQSSNLIQHE